MTKWNELTTYDRLLYKLRHDREFLDFSAKIVQEPARRWKEGIEHMMTASRKFVISNSAANRLRDSMASFPEYLSINSPFAIPPFETMWIEFDAKEMLYHELLSGEWSDHADRRIGYLIHKGKVRVFCEGTELQPYPTYIEYNLHEPMTFEKEQRLAEFFGVSRGQLEPFLWGHTLSQYLEQHEMRPLRDMHSIDVPAGLVGINNLGADSYRGSAGEMRNILAVLLMVNQPPKTIFTREVDKQRSLIRGKPLSYFGHSIIDINLDRRRRTNLLAKPERASRFGVRWHEVRGHFCHNKAAKASIHIHDWVEVADKRWKCTHVGCEAKRWWREYPEGHGSATVGYVDQVRMIKTKVDSR